jgi:hypothetical protein
MQMLSKPLNVKSTQQQRRQKLQLQLQLQRVLRWLQARQLLLRQVVALLECYRL